VNSAIDVVQDLREMAETCGVDVARLELVLVNLISNAIKYSARKPKRLVEIDMAPSFLRVAADTPTFGYSPAGRSQRDV
jgi:signal transduction histidine kinase